ncbi:MAG: phosphotransferase [bacterium]
MPAHQTPPVSATDIEAQINALMPTWQFAAVDNLAYLSGGYSNINYALDYQGKRYVLRIPQIAQPFVDRAHELAWYNTLPDDVGIRPLALDLNTGAMITPWIPGKLLADDFPRCSLEQYVRYLQKLHSSLPDAHRRYDLEAISSAYWENETAPVSLSNPPESLVRSCHNDLNPWNVIVTSAGWVTLDWEFVGHNDPLFDLVALHHGLQLAQSALPLFAQLYLGKPCPDLDERLHSVQTAYWLRELGWAHFQIKHGNHRAEIRAQLQMAEQALEALLRTA